MSFLPVYLDSSALLKLIVPEEGSAALERALVQWPDWLSSALAAVECRRVLKRIHAPAAIVDRARRVLDMTTLLKLDERVISLAGHLGSPDLRSLDAIHLASALSIGDLPEAFVTYDNRLAAAARRLRLTVIQPGR